MAMKKKVVKKAAKKTVKKAAKKHSVAFQYLDALVASEMKVFYAAYNAPVARAKKVVKKVAARKPVAQKDVYTYDVKGCFITYNSLKEVEQHIHDEANGRGIYGGGDEFEIYKLVKRVRLKASKMVIEEVKE